MSHQQRGTALLTLVGYALFDATAQIIKSWFSAASLLDCREQDGLIEYDGSGPSPNKPCANLPLECDAVLKSSTELTEGRQNLVFNVARIPWLMCSTNARRSNLAKKFR
ncbi:hypothetical protein BDR07DRAFT_1406864 [Suillus spraguei]|nr:hypothetical protein BDR07DRAFT_1406864 [Suillus spraguei]